VLPNHSNHGPGILGVDPNVRESGGGDGHDWPVRSLLYPSPFPGQVELRVAMSVIFITAYAWRCY